MVLIRAMIQEVMSVMAH